MSNQPINDADLLDIIKSEREKYEQAAEAERQALIEQRVRELLEEERAVERQENIREAEMVSAEYVVDPARERDRARETAKSAALLLIMLLLILLLIAAATGRTDILPIPGVQSTQTLVPLFRTTTSNIGLESVDGAGLPPGVTPQVDPVFQAIYERFGGLDGVCSIGKPISQSFIKNGQLHQWFERALLHEMPANITDSRWNPQGVLLGQEVTRLMPTPFPTTPPFLSRPDAYYFGQTGYSVSQPFLDFWNNCDGETLLGYPVSGVVYEVLEPEDKQPHQVQYFERGRLEYHPEDANRPVQFGLLGAIKKADVNFRPNIVTPQAATQVVPPTATQVVPATATLPPAATPIPPAPTAPGYPSP